MFDGKKRQAVCTHDVLSGFVMAEAQIELGKLLALARAGRNPDSDVTVAELDIQNCEVHGLQCSPQNR